jgi:membrane protein YqaA with SNARE-associated domain
MRAELSKRLLQWARHPQALYLLCMISFIESSFFPIAPDVMMIPMILAQRQRAWFLAGMTTLFSVIGGIFGYFIGLLFLKLFFPYLQMMGYISAFNSVAKWFDAWGYFAIILAGVTPIPYKLFTIAAGALHMSLVGFIIASCIGRGLRFFLVAATVSWGTRRLRMMDS